MIIFIPLRVEQGVWIVRHSPRNARMQKDKGKVFWLQYTGDAVCPIWKCCKEQKRENCEGCPDLPCGRFMKDPSISDEENEANLKKMIANLAMYKNKIYRT